MINDIYKYKALESGYVIKIIYFQQIAHEIIRIPSIQFTYLNISENFS